MRHGLPRRTFNDEDKTIQCQVSPYTFMFRVRQTVTHISCPSNSIRTSWVQVRNATVKHGRPPGRAKGTTKHWSEEKLQTKTDYPLTSALSDLIRPELSRGMKLKKVRGTSSMGEQKGSGVHVRTQIVSSRLCGTSTLDI